MDFEKKRAELRERNRRYARLLSAFSDVLRALARAAAAVAIARRRPGLGNVSGPGLPSCYL